MQLGVEASARIDLRENTPLQSVKGQMTLGLEQYENRNKDDPVRLKKHKRRRARGYSGSIKIGIFNLASDMDQACDEPGSCI